MDKYASKARVTQKEYEKAQREWNKFKNSPCHTRSGKQKHAYPTAKLAREQILATKNPSAYRIYQCPKCKYFHITFKKQAFKKKIRRKNFKITT